LLREHLGIGTAQALINLDSTDFTQVEAATVEEMVHNEGASRVHLYRRFAGTEPLVEIPLSQSDPVGLLPVEFAVRVDPVPKRPQFLFPRVIVPVGRGFHAANEWPAVVVINVGEERPHFFSIDDAQRMKERGYAHPTAAVNADSDGLGQIAPPRIVVRPGGQLDSGAPAG